MTTHYETQIVVMHYTILVHILLRFVFHDPTLRALQICLLLLLLLLVLVLVLLLCSNCLKASL